MSVSFFFTVAFFLTAAILLARSVARRRRRHATTSQPGRSPDAPVAVARFDEMDALINAARCACGGVLYVISEGSVGAGESRGRVVHTECGTCEETHDFFFDLSRLTH